VEEKLGQYSVLLYIEDYFCLSQPNEMKNVLATSDIVFAGFVALNTLLSVPFSFVTLQPMQAAEAATPVRTDFNGDGNEDLAVGVASEEINGGDAAGAVNVIYGSSCCLVAIVTPDGSGREDQLWSQDSTNVEGASEGGDLFGAALATGDFNNDGYDDLAIGVPQEDLDSPFRLNAGAVNVIYGSSAGLSAIGLLDGTGDPDQLWTQDSTGVLDSAEGGDAFGESLIAGDFNNDGYDDLAIGVPQEGFASDSSQAGAVHVIYGSNSGLSASTGVPDQLWHQDSPGVFNAVELGDRFGAALGAGDFNNDGYDDLAIGVPQEDIGTPAKADAGAVHVIYGSSAGLSATAVGGTGRDDQFWHQDSNNVNELAAGDDFFGISLTTGDFNGDNYADLAIGVFGEDVSSDSIEDGGAVNVIYGSSAGLSATTVGGTGMDDQLWWQGTSEIQETPEALDLFGESLTAGDFNNDGYDDLAIGVRWEDLSSNTISNAGVVNVIYGSSAGLSATVASDATGKADQLWSQASTSIIDAPEQSDEFGAALSAGDFNGDGYEDFAISVPREDFGTPAKPDAGAVHIIYGSASGLAAASNQFWNQDSAGIEDIAEGIDVFGYALASG